MRNAIIIAHLHIAMVGPCWDIRLMAGMRISPPKPINTTPREKTYGPMIFEKWKKG